MAATAAMRNDGRWDSLKINVPVVGERPAHYDDERGNSSIDIKDKGVLVLWGLRET